MFLLFLLSVGNIAISGLWESLLEFTIFRNTKKKTKIFLFLFYFDIFKVGLSPYFQLHKNFHQLVVLSIWFSKPFSSKMFSYQAQTWCSKLLSEIFKAIETLGGTPVIL